jgi:uncharacterized protein (TIGR00661 family)
MTNRPRILVAPLDWGLGHATRCIPIINTLLQKNVEVVIGADNRVLQLLRKEFVENGNLGRAIIKQLPAIFRGFRTEKGLLRQIIKEKRIDAVISDSRYGLYSSSIPSIFLTHQIVILLPSTFRWAQPCVSFMNRKFIRRFSECWIPDVHGEQNLSGALSHNVALPKNTFYIGPLSRLTKHTETKNEFDILAVISGPEPQRTIFEELIVEQLKIKPYRSFIVRGIPERNTRIKLSENVVAASSVTTKELAKLIASSSILISRPGYSTVMDLSFTGSNAIFVPTPQQTEQEYLAIRLMEKAICYSEPQDNFDIDRSLEESKKYSGFSTLLHDSLVLHNRIDALLNEIEKRKQ